MNEFQSCFDLLVDFDTDMECKVYTIFQPQFCASVSL